MRTPLTGSTCWWEGGHVGRIKGSKNRNAVKGWVKISTSISPAAAAYIQRQARGGRKVNDVIDKALLAAEGGWVPTHG